MGSDNRGEMDHGWFPRGTPRDPHSQRVAIPVTHPAIFGTQPVDEYAILGQPSNHPTNGHPSGHSFPGTTSYLDIHPLWSMEGRSVSHSEDFRLPVIDGR